MQRWLFVFLFSTIGSAIPLLWGAGELSFSSIILGGAGAIFGIWLAFKLNNSHY
ncbi:MAG TPA: hypothetical protein VN665_03330 [Candidatus Paceibacterota bacterium]|nr:hypothetical protein [Candidatus Paceibacterota bacterium]